MRKTEDYGQRRIQIRILFTLSILGLLIVGISSCNFPDINEILPISNSTEAPPVDLLTPTPLSTPTPDIPLVAPRQLIIWLPPQFDPEVETTSGNLLSYRLDEFVARRGQTQLQVRVKPLSGEFGLLESLELTASAAPLLMPDLVALPRSLLEEAFQEGMVIALDDYRDDIAENDWYEYASDLATVDGQTAGIPFAGDLMVLAYTDTAGTPPPTDWSSFLGIQRALSFPASDPQGLVTLAWYQSLGGELRGEDGSPTLDGDLMLQVLNFYEQAQDASIMPYWLTQFETDDQAWTSFLERQSTMAITWTSHIMESDSANTLLAAMPTKDDKAFTYADGWVWCVVPSDSDTEQFALELAEFLTDSEFLNTWAVEGGHLPVRPTSLESWLGTPYYSSLMKLLPAAVLVPEGDLEDSIGPAVRDAVVQVLKDQVDPQEALDTLIEVVLE